jgi:hypothetical protein
LAISDLATEAEAGVDVGERLQQSVSTALEDFDSVYDSKNLRTTFIRHLKAHGSEAAERRRAYAETFRRAAVLADRS